MKKICSANNLYNHIFYSKFTGADPNLFFYIVFFFISYFVHKLTKKSKSMFVKKKRFLLVEMCYIQFGLCRKRCQTKSGKVSYLSFIGVR